MEVRKIAKLAHLEITDAEVELYTPQMDNIVAYIEQLNELETDAVEPLLGGFTEEGRATEAMRADTVVPSLGQKAALDQAPAADKGHFRVPKVL